MKNDLWCGMDLHSDNVFTCLLNAEYKPVLQRRVATDMETILALLEPYRSRIQAVGVESTFNWYWLVDGLQDAGYRTLLANPARMQENIGLKSADDKSDARYIAKQMAMNVLPTGFIYPRDLRSTRDLYRRRMSLVQLRTREWQSLIGLTSRHVGVLLKKQVLTKLTDEEWEGLLGADETALRHARCVRRHIRQLEAAIVDIERTATAKLSLTTEYRRLMNVPGIGPVLATTIQLETGPLTRFKGPSKYASYCRLVKTSHTSNNRRKGDCNRKNGNRWLSWAYFEAATIAARHDPLLRTWYQRKKARTMRIVALKALANKLAKACYFILRDGVEFDARRLVG